jgi:hypothetical protein
MLTTTSPQLSHILCLCLYFIFVLFVGFPILPALRQTSSYAARAFATAHTNKPLENFVPVKSVIQLSNTPNHHLIEARSKGTVDSVAFTDLFFLFLLF